MIKKKLVVKNGSYQTRDGQEKNRWVTIGALHEYEGREYITLDGHIALPALIKDGDTRVFVSLFDPDNKGPARPQGGGGASNDFNDDVPFAECGHGGAWRVV